MENFNRQTSERFRQYDEKIQDKRKQCKEKCEKDIQKIILKDKIEKELTENIGALQTDIRTEDIPTCVCEKSVADKTEKVCLNCGKTMGAVAPAWGFVSGIGYVAWTQYVAAKILEVGIKKSVQVSLDKVMEIVTQIHSLTTAEIPKFSAAQILSSGNFTNNISLIDMVQYLRNNMYGVIESQKCERFGFILDTMGKNTLKVFNRNYHIQVEAVKNAVDAAEAAESLKLATNTSILTNTIIASVIAILVIVLVMVIIYLILHYRRKKKMKKKLQYIKLLKE